MTQPAARTSPEVRSTARNPNGRSKRTSACRALYVTGRAAPPGRAAMAVTAAASNPAAWNRAMADCRAEPMASCSALTPGK